MRDDEANDGLLTQDISDEALEAAGGDAKKEAYSCSWWC